MFETYLLISFVWYYYIIILYIFYITSTTCKTTYKTNLSKQSYLVIKVKTILTFSILAVPFLRFVGCFSTFSSCCLMQTTLFLSKLFYLKCFINIMTYTLYPTYCYSIVIMRFFLNLALFSWGL